MKRLALVAVVIALAGCQQEAKSSLDLEQENQRVAYAIGFMSGKGMSQQASDLNLDAYIVGLKAGSAGGEPAMTEEQMQKAISSYQRKKIEEHDAQMAEQQAENLELAAANLAVSEQFLAENAQKEGVVTTESGLEYVVVGKGEGASPSVTDTVEVFYHGTLMDGTVFDSSKERDQTVKFKLNQVIPGWTEGLQLMEVGATYTFYIPPQLAYGDSAPPSIGPNQVLIFEVELVAIEETPEAVDLN